MRHAPLRRPDREGFALVTSLLIILVLSLIAVAAVIIATTERRTTFAERIHSASVFAADAGGEAAIHFLRFSESPPPILDFGTFSVRAQGTTNLLDNQRYNFQARFAGKAPRMDGWGTAYVDYNYRVSSTGSADARSRSDVDMMASRLFREGY